AHRRPCRRNPQPATRRREPRARSYARRRISPTTPVPCSFVCQLASIVRLAPFGSLHVPWKLVPPTLVTRPRQTSPLGRYSSWSDVDSSLWGETSRSARTSSFCGRPASPIRSRHEPVQRRERPDGEVHVVRFAPEPVRQPLSVVVGDRQRYEKLGGGDP